MNKTRQQLRTAFGPPVRFKVKPEKPEARQVAGLEKLKTRLLRDLLTDYGQPGKNARLWRAADDAAALAWSTGYPLLFFPALLEEQARMALLQNERQERIFRQTRHLLIAA